jgi:hypothetical protein
MYVQNLLDQISRALLNANFAPARDLFLKINRRLE